MLKFTLREQGISRFHGKRFKNVNLIVAFEENLGNHQNWQATSSKKTPALFFKMLPRY